MKAPRLNRRLALERESAAPDGAGGFLRGWDLVGHLWGAVAPAAGGLAEGVEQRLARQGLRITLRGAPPGSPARPVAGQRLRDGSRVYAILAVTEADADGRFLICTAREEDRA